MDTIIYIYKKHGLAKPVIDSHQMKDYLLVRVGMNVGENQWFTHSIEPYSAMAAMQKITREQSTQDTMEASSHGFILEPFLKRLRECKKKRDRVHELKQRRQFFEEEHALVCQELEIFLSELKRYADQRYECCCVYGDVVRKSLVLPEDYGREDLDGSAQEGSRSWEAAHGRDTVRSLENACGQDAARSREIVVPSFWLPLLWQQYWQIPEFNAYLQPRWVEPLLENAMLHHFVVLGYAECTPTVILHCVRRMKSLRWILQEQDCTEELQGFVDDFYEDYGLAATLQSLPGGRAFARLLLVSKDPVCVLDFTREPRISPGGIAKGSIWIDFQSVEEKARRVLERQEGISYFSLKEIWKHAGKP